MQVYVCVICKVNTAPLYMLSFAHRRIFEAIVSPAVNIAKLKECRLLSCVHCQRLLQTIVMFQQTALVGVRHLLTLLTMVYKKPTPVSDPLQAKIKSEPEEDPLCEVKSFVGVEVEKERAKTQTLTDIAVKIEPEIDPSGTASCKSETEDSAKAHTVKKFVIPVRTAKTTVLPLNDKQLVKVAAPPRQDNDIKSLSDLSKSEITIDTFHATDEDVKLEFPVEVEEEVVGTPYPGAEVKCVENSGDEVGEEVDNDLETSDEDNDLETIDLVDEEISDESESEVCGAETLIDILNRKKSQNTTSIVFPSLNVQNQRKKPEKKDTNSKRIKDIPVLIVPQEPKKDMPQIFDPDFTYSKMLTKDEIMEWRKRKEKMEFYTSSVFKCEKCIEPFENCWLFLNHKKRHTELYGEVACDICQLRFIDAAALHYHMNSLHRLLKCNHCAHEWDNPIAMRRHCRGAHGAPGTAWGCDQCGHEAGSWQSLSMHSRVHRVRRCPECGLLVRTICLQKHMLKQHADLPSRRCAVCNAVFKGDNGLKAHMERHQKDESNFCVECNLHFRTKYAYRSHLRNTVKHAAPEDLRYHCKECGKCFLDHHALTNHIDAIHEKLKKYRCEQCGEAFRTVHARQRHARHVHAGHRPPKDKICAYCGKAFAAKRILEQHINTHTGARPYTCNLCGATFGFKSALYTHGRRVHHIQKKTAE